MKKEKYEILRKYIPNVELVSLISQNWYDSKHNLFPWSSSSAAYCGPNPNDVVYNDISTGGTPVGFYMWSTGGTWNLIDETNAYGDHQLPIYLVDSVDEMGIMVGFDGDIEEVEEFCNFTYAGNENTVTVYNPINTNKLKTIINSIFTISWAMVILTNYQCQQYMIRICHI